MKYRQVSRSENLKLKLELHFRRGFHRKISYRLPPYVQKSLIMPKPLEPIPYQPGIFSGCSNLRDALFDPMLTARFSPVKDAPVTCLDHRNGNLIAFKPADILMSRDDFEYDCVDITCVSPI